MLSKNDEFTNGFSSKSPLNSPLDLSVNLTNRFPATVSENIYQPYQFNQSQPKECLQVQDDCPEQVLYENSPILARKNVNSTSPQPACKAYDLVQRPARKCENLVFESRSCERMIASHISDSRYVEMPKKTLDMSSNGLAYENDVYNVGNENGHEDFDRTHSSLDEIDGVMDPVDEDDGVYLPPLPSRNYQTYVNSSELIENDSNLSRHPVSSKADTDVSSSSTHMSWHEVMEEARMLGIPLSCQASDNQSVTSSSQKSLSLSRSDRVRNSEEELSFKEPSLLLPSPVKYTKEMNQLKKNSPFKEKFSLQNLFSRKTKANHTRDHSSKGGSSRSSSSVFRHNSAVDMQKRGLPAVPQNHSTNHHNPSQLHSNGRRAMSNLHLPSKVQTANKSWGSSFSVPSHGLSMSDSLGSIGSLSSQASSRKTPASSSGYGNGSGEYYHGLYICLLASFFINVLFLGSNLTNLNSEYSWELLIPDCEPIQF